MDKRDRLHLLTRAERDKIWVAGKGTLEGICEGQIDKLVKQGWLSPEQVGELMEMVEKISRVINWDEGFLQPDPGSAGIMREMKESDWQSLKAKYLPEKKE